MGFLGMIKRNSGVDDTIKLREYQQKIIDEWLETDDDLAFSASRRIGKSILIIKYVDKYLSENPNSTCYFFSNTLEQAVDIVAKNTTEDGRPYLGAVINTNNLVPSRYHWLHNGKELWWRNGSKLKLGGVINSTVSKMGTNCDLVVYDEAGLMGNQFKELYDLMSPSLALTGGRQIAVSTVRFGSDFNDIFLNDREGWHKVILKADEVYVDGERLLTDEFLEKQKAKQSIERFLQEWFCDLETANETSIYAQSFEKAEFIDDFVLTKADRVFCSVDLGINDSSAFVFAVERRDEIIVFDYYENSNEPTQHYIDMINSKPFRTDTVVVPHDGKNRHDAGRYLVSRASLYARAGFNVNVLRAISQLEGIEVTRAAMQTKKIKFANTNSVLNLIDTIKQYEWKKNRDEIEYKPVHNRASNTADALEYMAIYFYYNDFTEDNDQVFEAFQY